MTFESPFCAHPLFLPSEYYPNKYHRSSSYLHGRSLFPTIPGKISTRLNQIYTDTAIEVVNTLSEIPLNNPNDICLVTASGEKGELLSIISSTSTPSTLHSLQEVALLSNSQHVSRILQIESQYSQGQAQFWSRSASGLSLHVFSPTFSSSSTLLDPPSERICLPLLGTEGITSMHLNPDHSHKLFFSTNAQQLLSFDANTQQILQQKNLLPIIERIRKHGKYVFPSVTAISSRHTHEVYFCVGPFVCAYDLRENRVRIIEDATERKSKLESVKFDASRLSEYTALSFGCSSAPWLMSAGESTYLTGGVRFFDIRHMRLAANPALPSSSSLCEVSLPNFSATGSRLRSLQWCGKELFAFAPTWDDVYCVSPFGEKGLETIKGMAVLNAPPLGYGTSASYRPHFFDSVGEGGNSMQMEIADDPLLKGFILPGFHKTPTATLTAIGSANYSQQEAREYFTHFSSLADPVSSFMKEYPLYDESLSPVVNRVSLRTAGVSLSHMDMTNGFSGLAVRPWVPKHWQGERGEGYSKDFRGYLLFSQSLTGEIIANCAGFHAGDKEGKPQHPQSMFIRTMESVTAGAGRNKEVEERGERRGTTALRGIRGITGMGGEKGASTWMHVLDGSMDTRTKNPLAFEFDTTNLHIKRSVHSDVLPQPIAYGRVKTYHRLGEIWRDTDKTSALLAILSRSQEAYPLLKAPKRDMSFINNLSKIIGKKKVHSLYGENAIIDSCHVPVPLSPSLSSNAPPEKFFNIPSQTQESQETSPLLSSSPSTTIPAVPKTCHHVRKVEKLLQRSLQEEDRLRIFSDIMSLRAQLHPDQQEKRDASPRIDLTDNLIRSVENLKIHFPSQEKKFSRSTVSLAVIAQAISLRSISSSVAEKYYGYAGLQQFIEDSKGFCSLGYKRAMELLNDLSSSNHQETGRDVHYPFLSLPFGLDASVIDGVDPDPMGNSRMGPLQWSPAAVPSRLCLCVRTEGDGGNTVTPKIHPSLRSTVAGVTAIEFNENAMRDLSRTVALDIIENFDDMKWVYRRDKIFSLLDSIFDVASVCSSKVDTSPKTFHWSSSESAPISTLSQGGFFSPLFNVIMESQESADIANNFSQLERDKNKETTISKSMLSKFYFITRKMENLMRERGEEGVMELKKEVLLQLCNFETKRVDNHRCCNFKRHTCSHFLAYQFYHYQVHPVDLEIMAEVQLKRFSTRITEPIAIPANVTQLAIEDVPRRRWKRNVERDMRKESESLALSLGASQTSPPAPNLDKQKDTRKKRGRGESSDEGEEEEQEQALATKEHEQTAMEGLVIRNSIKKLVKKAFQSRAAKIQHILMTKINEHIESKVMKKNFTMTPAEKNLWRQEGEDPSLEVDEMMSSVLSTLREKMTKDKKTSGKRQRNKDRSKDDSEHVESTKRRQEGMESTDEGEKEPRKERRKDVSKETGVDEEITPTQPYEGVAQVSGSSDVREIPLEEGGDKEVNASLSLSQLFQSLPITVTGTGTSSLEQEKWNAHQKNRGRQRVEDVETTIDPNLAVDFLTSGCVIDSSLIEALAQEWIPDTFYAVTEPFHSGRVAFDIKGDGRVRHHYRASTPQSVTMQNRKKVSDIQQQHPEEWERLVSEWNSFGNEELCHLVDDIDHEYAQDVGTKGKRKEGVSPLWNMLGQGLYKDVYKHGERENVEHVSYLGTHSLIVPRIICEKQVDQVRHERYQTRAKIRETAKLIQHRTMRNKNTTRL